MPDSTGASPTLRLGLTLSSEEHGAQRLVRLARQAEQHGFDFVSISDHFHPWVPSQGHAPFVWSVLGAIAASTERIEVGVGVTCPIMRVHPAVVAHAAATVAELLPGRFWFGVGTGEALNEHILGDRWPPVDVRLEMLEEAIGLIRELWAGGRVTRRGRHYTVENARLYDAPTTPPPLLVSAFGPRAAELAARAGDGLWMSTPSAQIVERFSAAGGTGARFAQLTLCWAPTRAGALDTVLARWPNAGVSGQLVQDLPTPEHFRQATAHVTEEDIAAVPCGPDAAPIVDKVRDALRAGVDHLYLHQVGDDQDGFLAFWDRELRHAVGEVLAVDTQANGDGGRKRT